MAEDAGASAVSALEDSYDSGAGAAAALEDSGASAAAALEDSGANAAAALEDSGANAAIVLEDSSEAMGEDAGANAETFCAICKNELDHEAQFLACGHRFHKRCIGEYCRILCKPLEGVPCPVCRKTLDDMNQVAQDTQGYNQQNVTSPE